MKLYDFQNERFKKRAFKKLSRAGQNWILGRKPKNIPALIVICLLLLLAYLVPSPRGGRIDADNFSTFQNTSHINGRPFSSSSRRNTPLTGNASVIDEDAPHINGRRFSPSSQRNDSLTGNALVIDGDTLHIDGQRFRLFGIDAPEIGQTCERNNEAYSCGNEAAEALTQLVSGQVIVCEKEDIDKYNRIVAICRAGETELNKWMVAHGFAVAYREYSNRYLFDEMKARLNGVGVWSGPFQMPWDYRHEGK